MKDETFDDFKKNLKNIFLTNNQLAELLNVSDRTIRFWCESQGAPREERGKYPLFPYLLWRINKLTTDLEIAQSSGDEKLHALKVETQKIVLAERKEKYKKMLGELVDFDMVQQAWRSEISFFRKAMNAFKTKLFHSLEDVPRDKQFLLIEREVNEALNSMSENLEIEHEIDKNEILNLENEENDD